MSAGEKRRRVYPGVVGLYSDAAWDRADLFTDGHITDAILQACEAQVEAAAVADREAKAGATNLYAVDGKCHNSEPGHYGHECGKPATWLGTDPSGFVSGFCTDCKERGREARPIIRWDPIEQSANKTR